MFALLVLPSAALAWRPAPGIPLERQLPANRQTFGSGSGSGGCDFDPWISECNETEIWCDSGYYNNNQCWYGNYCLQQISDWDGCPGVCHEPCNWDTQDYCDMGMDANNCWLGNYCMDKSSGGCPPMTGSGSMDYGSNDYGSNTWTSSGSGSSCFDAYTQECNATEIYCDAGMDSEGCWYGNYCLNQVNEWDGCYGVCSMNCNWETEDWCDMGTDSNGCWMGNWCQDKSMGGCPPPMGGSELASGEDICAHMTWTEECGATQISCDSGYSSEGCWFGNYCIDSVNSWDSCPGMCSTMCNWDTEEWCDMGTDSNGCWMGNWCQPMEQGGCPDVNMVSKRGFMEKQKAMAHRSDFWSNYGGSDYGYFTSTGSGSDYGFTSTGSGSDYGFTNTGSGFAYGK